MSLNQNQISDGTITAADTVVVGPLRPLHPSPSSDLASTVRGTDPSIVPSRVAVDVLAAACPWKTAVPLRSASVELIAIARDGPGHQVHLHLACFRPRNRAVCARCCLP